MSLLSTAISESARVGWQVRGKRFYDASGKRLAWSGVTYGPFEPRVNEHGVKECWPEAGQLERDLRHIRGLGFDVLRVYEKPSVDLLKVCEVVGLKLLVGVAWTQHVDFINQPELGLQAKELVRETVRALADESVVVAFLVGNEVEKTLVRWMGPDRVRDFLEELIGIVHEEVPGKPVSYASYPSTEYLVPRNADFVCFNVFLERRETFASYLQHLQNLAGNRPLVISEFGLDSKAHGEGAQAELRGWFEEECWRAGVAGRCWFSYTDDWHRGGEAVTGWEFGLVTRERREKQACGVRCELPPPGRSRISVVVCTRNGAATLMECLEALRRLSHPAHEVLIIDDGSTDRVPEIARGFPEFRYQRQDHAGLSAARNLGMSLATGDVVAYTDDDCFPDEDWLWHLSLAFEDEGWVGVGGPNLSPVPRTVTEACVAAAPGAPSHVLVDDFEAEHLPGCNLAIRKSALEAIGGFREEFTTAGDDVDVCWRLQRQGGRLRFVPAAMVWHHRRFTVRAYLRQQSGYGYAEARLIRSYAEKFAWFSGARWRGAIYGDGAGEMAKLNQQEIHFGQYGMAPFQCVYSSWDSGFWTWWCGLPWLVLVMLSVLTGSVLLCGGLLAMGVIAAQRRASRFDDGLKNPDVWQRWLLWMLCLAQPVVRDWARLKGMVQLRAWPKGEWNFSAWKKKAGNGPRWKSSVGWRVYWNTEGVGRERLLESLVASAGEFGLEVRSTGEASFWDLEIKQRGEFSSWWMATVTEYHEAEGRLTRVQLQGSDDGGVVREWFESTVRAVGLQEVRQAEVMARFLAKDGSLAGIISNAKA